MRISTKTLATLLVVTAVAAAVPGMSRMPGNRRRQESQFDRLLQHHDRKGELRSRVLGIEPLELRTLQSKMPFNEIARRSGFVSERAFRIALLGKIKEELRLRGWKSGRIDEYVSTRSKRLG